MLTNQHLSDKISLIKQPLKCNNLDFVKKIYLYIGGII